MPIHTPRRDVPRNHYLRALFMLLVSTRVLGFAPGGSLLAPCRSSPTMRCMGHSTFALPTHVRNWLDIKLPEGQCKGITMEELPESDPRSITPDHIAQPHHWAHAAYHPDEIQFGLQLPPATAPSFWIGRLTMRTALDFPKYAILRDSYGRPHLPLGTCASVSHKQQSAVALVSDRGHVVGVGVDLEYTSRPGRRSIARRILTDNELLALGAIPGVSSEQEVLLRFSLKEAIYKAVHPLLRQYVPFKEAEVTPHADGTATCEWFLDSGADHRLANLTAHWRILDDGVFFLCSASVEEALDS